MKTLMLLALLYCSNVFAATSACQVLVVSNGQGGTNFGYNVQTACDGKILSTTPVGSSISESYTAALHTLFAGGYNISTCTLESTDTANGNNAIVGTYNCLLVR